MISQRDAHHFQTCFWTWDQRCRTSVWSEVIWRMCWNTNKDNRKIKRFRRNHRNQAYQISQREAHCGRDSARAWRTSKVFYLQVPLKWPQGLIYHLWLFVFISGSYLHSTTFIRVINSTPATTLWWEKRFRSDGGESNNHMIRWYSRDLASVGMNDAVRFSFYPLSSKMGWLFVLL